VTKKQKECELIKGEKTKMEETIQKLST